MGTSLTPSPNLTKNMLRITIIQVNTSISIPVCSSAGFLSQKLRFDVFINEKFNIGEIFLSFKFAFDYAGSVQ